VQPTVTRTAASITFVASEFARIRGYVEREFTGDMALSPPNNTAVYLQLEGSIGAHGAHPF
jgi:hypothetical protein